MKKLLSILLAGAMCFGITASAAAASDMSNPDSEAVEAGESAAEPGAEESTGGPGGGDSAEGPGGGDSAEGSGGGDSAGGPGGGDSAGGSAAAAIEDINLQITEYPEGTVIVLKGAAVLDKNHSGEVLDVKVQDGIITEVGENLEGDEVIDLTGCTLMPGMIDSHVHVAGSAGYNITLLKTFLSQGITSVREEGMLSTENEEDFISLIEEANSDPSYACLVSCGKYLDVAGGYGMGPTGNMGITITNAEEAVSEIEHKFELGYTQVKIGINSDENRMTGEEISAITRSAHDYGMTTAAHINYARYLEELADYGIDEAAHTPNDEMSSELIWKMIENNIAMNTSGAEDNEEIKILNLKNFYEAGGFITVGTDKMRGYDSSMESLIAEMAVLAEAGLTVQEVIGCTTYNNAKALNINAGLIEAGYEADIIAVQGEVDEFFTALLDVDFIMNDGACVEAE